METRILVAYALIALLVAAMIGGIAYWSREKKRRRRGRYRR